MANGDSIFDAIKDILNKDVLSDSDAHRLLLAGQLDLNKKFEKRLVISETKEKEQKEFNEMVKTLWRERKVTLWVYGIIVLGIFGIIFDAIKITINTGN